MCLWLLTACIGLIPTNQVSAPIIVLPGVPPPIVQPTPAPTLQPTPPGNISFPPSDPPPSPPPTMPPAPPPTVTPAPPEPQPTTMPAPPPTTPPAPPPTTPPAPPTIEPTPPPTMPPTPPPTMPPGPPPTMPPAPSPTMTNPPSLPFNQSLQLGVLLPVVICQNPSMVCVANPNQPSTVFPPIDPRLGTTPKESSSLQLPPVSAYSGQLPLYDTAVKFPRNRRSLQQKNTSGNKVIFHKHNIRKRQSCVCVPAGTCPPGGAGNLGNGLIDFRIVTPNNPCGPGTENCCIGSNPNPTPAPPPRPIACGMQQTPPAVVVTPEAGQADYGEYPWMVIILTKQNDYIAGGVLIDQFNVLTVIHRLTPYLVDNTAPNVKIRLGEWDAAGTYEPVPFQEYSISKVFRHPNFNPNTLQHDLAVLRLASSVPITPQPGSVTTINRACLPASPTSAYTGQRCRVTGWGKDAFGVQGNYQQILKEVEVPIVAPAACQASLRAARLGPNFVLDTTSFICAGGEAQRDSCTGDGGSGLVCNVNGQWTVIGLVAWGLGCATTGVPAAYVNLAAMLPWIQQQLATP